MLSHLLISFPPGRGSGRARGAAWRVRVCDCDGGPLARDQWVCIINNEKKLTTRRHKSSGCIVGATATQMPRSSNRLQPPGAPVGMRDSSRHASSSTRSSSLVPEQLTQLTNVVAKPTAAALAQQIPCLSLFDHAGSLYAGSLCWLQHRPAVEGGALRRTPSCTASSKRSATSERRSPSCCPAARRARPETAGSASARPLHFTAGSKILSSQAARSLSSAFPISCARPGSSAETTLTPAALSRAAVASPQSGRM